MSSAMTSFWYVMLAEVQRSVESLQLSCLKPDEIRKDVNIMKMRSGPGEPIRLEQMLQVEGNENTPTETFD